MDKIKSTHRLNIQHFIIVSLKYEHTTFHQENTYEPTILHTTGSRTACPPPLWYNRFQRKSCELVSGQKEGSYPCEVFKINPDWSWGYRMTFICCDKVSNQSSPSAHKKWSFLHFSANHKKVKEHLKSQKESPDWCKTSSVVFTFLFVQFVHNIRQRLRTCLALMRTKKTSK